MKAMCGGELDGFCKGLGGVRPCPDHEKVIMGEKAIDPEPRDTEFTPDGRLRPLKRSDLI